MQIEITTADAMSTSSTIYTEIADCVYRSEETGKILIVAQDGQTAVTVTP